MNVTSSMKNSGRKPIFGHKNNNSSAQLYNTSPNLYKTDTFKMNQQSNANINHRSTIIYSPRNANIKQQNMYQSVSSQQSQPITIKIKSPVEVQKRTVTPPARVSISPAGRPAYSISKMTPQSHVKNPIIVRPSSVCH